MATREIEIVVLLREVIDPRPPAQPTEEGAMIRDRGLRRIVNPADLEALEVALGLPESLVTAVAIGPRRIEDGLRVALAMGACRAIRVWDHGLEGGDACSDARLLSRVLQILRPSLFVAGSRLADRGDEPSTALAAALLDLPVVNAAVSCKLSGGGVEVSRKGDRGARQRISAPTPCAVLFEVGSAIPRYPDTEAFLAASVAEVECWGLPELDLPPWEVGEEGARLLPHGVSFPRPQPVRAPTPAADLPAPDRVAALLSGGIKARAGVMHFGTPDEVAQGLLRILRQEGLVEGGAP